MSVTKRIPIAIGIKPNQQVEFTNKTIDGTKNTIQNIPISSLDYNSITLNGTTIPLGTSATIGTGDIVVDTNTTYNIKFSSINNGASLDLDASGSGSGTDSVYVLGGGNISVSRLDNNTIRISDAGNLGGVSITDSSVSTLTNKTINGNNNTLTNIQNSSLQNSTITINDTPVSLGGSITIAGGSGGGDPNSIQTFTNKTISGSNNTLLNIPNSALNNPFIRINGSQVSLGSDFTVSGLGNVTTDGLQDLSNKSLLAPIIQNAKLIGYLTVGSGSGSPGVNGQVLKSTGNGLTWANENQVTGASLTIGSGLTGSGGTEFNGSNGITVSINTGVVATLTSSQTLSNKTLTGPNLTGDLKVNNVSGTAGQTIVSDGAGGLAWGAGGGGGGGSFNGPVSSTDNAILRYDGTTGDLAQNSLVTISDTGIITAPSVASVIPFYHSSELTFPSASSVNGAIAVSASTNSVHYASNGNWIQLAKSSDVTVSSRQTFSTTTASLSNNSTAYPNITGYKSYLLLKIQTDKAAWVRVYTSNTARSADSARSIDTDPSPGSGVLAEVITTGASTQVLTPATIGFNDDSSPTDTIYLAITNRSGSTGTLTVTLTALKLEA